MDIYNNNKQLLSALGVEGNYSTDFEVRKAILTALGGDATECNTIYEVDTQILKIYEEGGGGSDGSNVFDLSGKINFSSMFNGCTNLIEAPRMITSDGTDFSYMFLNCTNLTSVPQLDTSKGTTFHHMFSGCSKITTIPQLDTSNGTSFSDMFYWCSNLTTIPQLDTSNGTTFNSMFYWCSNLTTIPQLDASKGTYFYNMFWNCTNLENITFTGSINISIDFPYCTKLTYDSVKSILTACSNTTNTDSKTLKFNRTLTDQDSELAALIATCTSKGWTISGLTLN